MSATQQNQTKAVIGTANKIANELDLGTYKSAVGFTSKDKHTANRRIWIANTIEKITQFIQKHFRKEQKSEAAIYAALEKEKEKEKEDKNNPNDVDPQQVPQQKSTYLNLDKLWQELLDQCTEIARTIKSAATTKVNSLTQSISITSKELHDLGLNKTHLEKIATALESNVLLGDSIENADIERCLKNEENATVDKGNINTVKRKIIQYIEDKNEKSQAESLTNISAQELAEFTLSSSLLSKAVPSPSPTSRPQAQLSDSDNNLARNELLNNYFHKKLSKAAINFVLTQSSTPMETCALAKALSASDINNSFLRLEKNDKRVNLNPDNDLSHYNTLRIVQASYEQKSTTGSFDISLKDEIGESLKGAFEHVTSKVTSVLSKSTQFIRNALGMEKPAISSDASIKKNEETFKIVKNKAKLLGELTRLKEEQKEGKEEGKEEGKNEASNKFTPSWVRKNRLSTKVAATSEKTESKAAKPKSPKM